MNWFGALGAAVLGSLPADLLWFYLGRLRGQEVLSLLCRISLEPYSCVQRTQNVFTRYGMRGVVVAKFIPGLSTLVPPLAGNAGESASRFLAFDALGAFLHSGTFMLAGYLFSRQLEQVMKTLAGFGHGALGVIIGLAGAYLGFRCFQRQRLLRQLRVSRITVDELHQRMNAGENLLILDLRSHTELEQDPTLIRGARHMALDEVHDHQDEIPRDREVVLYCSCPSEASSVRAALVLLRRGILRVRPLLGGIQAWREHNYPLDVVPARAPVGAGVSQMAVDSWMIEPLSPPASPNQ